MFDFDDVEPISVYSYEYTITIQYCTSESPWVSESFLLSNLTIDNILNGITNKVTKQIVETIKPFSEADLQFVKDYKITVKNNIFQLDTSFCSLKSKKNYQFHIKIHKTCEEMELPQNKGFWHTFSSWYDLYCKLLHRKYSLKIITPWDDLI